MISLLVFAFLLGLCSGSPTRNTPRILHGTPTTITEFPSVVQVNQYDTAASYWQFRCGGNILANNIVLTSALCFWHDDVDRYRIRAGTTYRNRGGVLVYFSSILIHPNFEPTASSDDFADIALVHLRDRLTFGDTISFISIIPQGWEIPHNSPGSYAGWGLTQEEVDVEDYTQEAEIPLQTLNVTIYSHEYCRKLFEDLLPLNPDVFCAGNNDESGIYGSDNGGPLYYGGVLAGLIAGRPSCDDPLMPSANLKISAYTNWIVENA